MNISEPFIRRPVATSLLSIALLLAGVLAYRQLPVAPLPQVAYPVISVGAALPGASPETMASAEAPTTRGGRRGGTPPRPSQLAGSLEEVRGGLARVNANKPKGELSAGSNSWTITATDQLFDANQYRPVIVAYRNGAPIRLGDVA